MHELQRVQPPVVDGSATLSNGDALVSDPYLLAGEQFDVVARLHQLTLRERTKTMVMFFAAQPGTGIVGFWSDD